MKVKLLAALVVVLCVTSFIYAMDEKKGMIYQTFKAYSGSVEDPFTLLYPLEVTGPGKIRIYVDIKKASKKATVNITLCDIRMFDKMEPGLWEKWMKFEDKYLPFALVKVSDIKEIIIDNIKYNIKKFLGKKDKPPKWFHGRGVAWLDHNARIEHAVDDKELMVTEGKYVVIIDNRNLSEIEGEMLIDFPGEIFDVERSLWETIPNKADLLVKDITLARGNRIVVTVSKDKGWMPDALWKVTGAKAVKLQITVGDELIEKDLPQFDPERKLKYGDVSYTVPDITITQETSVTAFIDATNKVVERSTGNNKKTVILNPKEQGASGPRQK